ncbi:DNA repair protein RecO [Nitrococcus mobilis]|uniref:DNA repair protein RecO n=1 Tax=Nitrococcus mobilis Nb-231 TaxID=314278 RepID=A4BRZ6_9GAMM|nr:DNA repair protein RecO [Nitrococcus mobilis]EAR21475.1 Recombination protein O, RecO [Nitrococcus mobilis Nb-231]
MMAERRSSLLEPAYVLHRRAYRESSAIAELFTAEHGRLGVVARGVRSSRSRWRALLQPFTPLSVSWQARGDLGTLTDVELQWRSTLPTGRRLVSGFYLNELLLRVLQREDPYPELFQCYAGAVLMLASRGAEQPLLRCFERDLLAAMGYGLLLSHDADGSPIEPQRWYRYEIDKGAVPVTAPRGRLVVQGATLSALASGVFPNAGVEVQARQLMRAALRPHVGERPLKSRELYAQYLGAKSQPQPRGDG